jgi:hypothetical protein
MARAALYLIMHQYDEALADAESARALGALDLTTVFLVEGVTLANHDNPDDLKLNEVISAGLNVLLKAKRENDNGGQ